MKCESWANNIILSITQCISPLLKFRSVCMPREQQGIVGAKITLGSHSVLSDLQTCHMESKP